MLGVVLRSHKSPTPVPLLLAHSRELEDNHTAAWISLRRGIYSYCNRQTDLIQLTLFHEQEAVQVQTIASQ